MHLSVRSVRPNIWIFIFIYAEFPLIIQGNENVHCNEMALVKKSLKLFLRKKLENRYLQATLKAPSLLTMPVNQGNVVSCFNASKGKNAPSANGSSTGQNTTGGSKSQYCKIKLYQNFRNVLNGLGKY